MQPREKRLLLITLGLGGALALLWLVQLLDFGSTRQLEIERLEAEIAKDEATINQAMAASSFVADANRRALPRDLRASGSAYLWWMFSIGEQAGITDLQVTPGAVQENLSKNAKQRQGKNFVAPLKFTMTGHGSWKQIASLLNAFYSAGHLQRTVSLSLTPKNDQIDLKWVVEAAQLATADRAEELTKLAGPSLPRALEDYQGLLAKRSLFAEYQPPPPPKPPVVEAPPPPPKPKFDTAKYAFLTAITEKEQSAQLLVLVRTTGQRLLLAEGDQFAVGEFKGKVLQIQSRAALLEVAGKRLLLSLGENLRQAVEVPREAF